MIERDNKKISITKQCDLLNINRAGLYYEPRDQQDKKIKDDDAMVKEMRQFIEEHNPIYGSRKFKTLLNGKGFPCSRTKVIRLMQDNNIYVVQPAKKTTISNKQHKKYPYLLRNLKITYANQAWAIDITYIKIRNGYVYLVCIIDIFSRKIVGWILSPFLDKAPCLEVFKNAVNKNGHPDIANTDQGSQFTSEEWVRLVLSYGTNVSMDGKGRWADNIFIERFFKSLKWEAIYFHSLESLEHAKIVIDKYITFYNNERLHQALDYKTPQKVYESSLAKQQSLENKIDHDVDGTINIDNDFANELSDLISKIEMPKSEVSMQL